jgi:hypothetical protein
MMRSGHRRPWLLAGLLAVLALAACENPGLDGREAEFARQHGEKGFAVVAVSAQRAVFAARGKRIVVEPPQGYCLDEDSVAVTRNAAFALVADCMQDHQAKLKNGAGAGRAAKLKLPRVFPGILTVSVSGEPAYGSEAGALDAFEELLEDGAGLKLLGRGDSTAPGSIIATRRIGGALYVLIEEPGAGSASILAPRFWRAFININGRLSLVTLSSFSDRPMAEDAMMGFLAQQMIRLRRINGLPIDREETEIANQMAESFDSEEDRGGLTAARAVLPAPRKRVARAPAPARAPPAPRRPG